VLLCNSFKIGLTKSLTNIKIERLTKKPLAYEVNSGRIWGITPNVLQLQVRGGIRSRNVSACTGFEHEANTCKFALHPP
jgi:hypothetical protein